MLKIASGEFSLTAFEIKLAKMRRAGRAVGSVYQSMTNRVAHIQKGILQTPNADLKLLETCETLRIKLKEMGIT